MFSRGPEQSRRPGCRGSAVGGRRARMFDIARRSLYRATGESTPPASRPAIGTVIRGLRAHQRQSTTGGRRGQRLRGRLTAVARRGPATDPRGWTSLGARPRTEGTRWGGRPIPEAERPRSAGVNTSARLVDGGYGVTGPTWRAPGWTLRMARAREAGPATSGRRTAGRRLHHGATLNWTDDPSADGRSVAFGGPCAPHGRQSRSVRLDGPGASVNGRSGPRSAVPRSPRR